jgi:hypothetical protein
LVKHVVHPTTGKKFYFGSRRVVALGPHLRIENYMMRRLPLPPKTLDYTPAAAAGLSQMYLNDTEGDCVIAEMAHTENVLQGNALAKQLIFSDTQINALYSAIGGYVPGNPSTDNGCDPITALNFWHQKGLLVNTVHSITSWMSVNAMEPVEVATALYLFENLMFAVGLPDAWVANMPSSSGFIWDVAGAADENNGHCFLGTGFDANGNIKISTWGMLGTITQAALQTYANNANESAGGNLFCVVSPDSLNRAQKKAPSGFDWSQLIADMESMK